MNQCLLRNQPGSGSCDLSWLLARKIMKGIHSCKRALLNRPIRPPEIGLKSERKKSTDRAFPNIKLNSVATTAVNQNVTDTYIKHKGEWHNTSHKWQHQFPKRNSSADDNQLTQFLSAAGLGNKTKLTLSLRLQLFRLIHLYLVSTCVSFLVSWSSTLNPSGKCCCALTVWLCHSRSHFWDSFLCWLPGKHHWSACQDIQFVSVWWGDWFWLKTVIITFQKMESICVCQILVTGKALPTVRHRRQFWGERFFFYSHVVQKVW